MRKFAILFAMALTSCVLLNACGGGQEENVNPNLFQIEQNRFVNPDKQYRPLWNLYSISPEVLDRVEALGFGGVTSNVPWNGYLTQESDFQALRDAVEYAKNRGLRIWLFDEKGWPSGKAGGMVLKEDASLEAQGLVCLNQQVAAGSAAEFALPVGHTEVVASYALLSDGTTVDLMSLLGDDKSLYYQAQQSCTVYYLVSKPFYEGTHATENWVEKLRYPDFLQRRSTELFLNSTHEKYYEYLAPYFGNTVEAFFTEEPQLLGYYMGTPPVSPAEIDKVNPNLPLYPTLNFSSTFLSEFRTRRGYDLRASMHLLFGGDSEQALKTRWDYHQTVSDLYYENFNKVYADWCASRNVAYSGHFLFEEYSVHHAMFMGNILKQLSAQQIPGVDMLSTMPATVQDYAITSLKYGQSAAHLTGKRSTMAELSSSIDSAVFGVEEMKGNAAIHAVYGYDKITSFYQHNNIPEQVTREFNTYSGRMSMLIEGGDHVAEAALFYPAESIFASTLPSAQRYMGWRDSIDYGEEADRVDNGIRTVAAQLASMQIDYDFIDSEFLSGCRVENGELVTAAGERFKALILPYVNAIPAQTLTLIGRFRDQGLKVCVNTTSRVFRENRTAFEALGSRAGYSNAAQLKALIREWDLGTVLPARDLGAVRYLCQHYDNADNFLFVNTGANVVNSEVTLRVKGSRVTVYNPDTASVEAISFNTDANGYPVVSLRLPKYGALLYSVQS